MGYLSCSAESSIATCRSIASYSPTQLRQEEPADGGEAGSSSSLFWRIKRFSYAELAEATGNFSEDALLGRGSHGAVYKAVLHGSSHPVAVKRPSRRPQLLHHLRNWEVDNEIRILSRIRSPGLVNLVGFTEDGDGVDDGDEKRRWERLLVVEFMPNGTLYDYLHSNPRPPGWARRLRLALQTAKALLTLHSAAPPVIHRDVKSANVLIDRQFNARLSDFGLAFRCDVKDGVDASSVRPTPPAGTLGYLDPCYVSPENLSTKTDVFSFGILLLEIMSGRKAIDVVHSPPSVVEWAVPLLRKGKVLALYDPRIPPPRDPVARRRLGALAASCVRSSKDRRPSMEEVVEQLKVLRKTVPSGAWNGLTVGNPCSVIDTERTTSRICLTNFDSNLSSSSISKCISIKEQQSLKEEEASVGVKKMASSVKVVHPLRNVGIVAADGGMRGSRNLKDLMASQSQEPIGVARLRLKKVSQEAVIRRARTLSSSHDHFDSDGMLRMRRSKTAREAPSKMFSNFDGSENGDGRV